MKTLFTVFISLFSFIILAIADGYSTPIKAAPATGKPLLVAGLSHTPAQGSGAGTIDIQAPISAENGAMVQFYIKKLDPPLMPGQTLNLYSNGQLACAAKVSGFSVSRFSTSVRMTGSGTVEAQVVDQQGQVLASASKTIKVNNGATIPASGSSSVSSKGLRTRQRKEGFRVDAYVKHDLPAGHVGQIDFNTSVGTLAVTITPYCGGTSFNKITFYATKDLGTVEVSTSGSSTR